MYNVDLLLESEFLELPFVELPKQPSPNRAFQKAASAAIGHTPAPDAFRVTTVRLRRSGAPHTTPTGESGRYTHQWLVSGHWRNQWYPSRQDHAPIYIMPHVKGPTDTPLTVNRTVYVANR